MDSDGQMNVDKIKSQLAGRLKLAPERFDHLWAYLEKEHFVAEVRDDIEGPEFLEQKAREQLELSCVLGGHTSSPPGRSPSSASPVHVDLSEYEKACAEALSHHLAQWAASRLEVRRFRETLPGGSVLSLEEADEVLKQQLRSLFPEDTVQIMAGREDFRTLALQTLVEGEVPNPFIKPQPRPPVIVVGGEMHLEDLANWLAHDFLWEPADALWFLLTDEVPAVTTLEVEQDRRRGVFKITVQPWVSADTWGHIYRGIQDVVRGRDNRPLKPRTLAVLRFVSKEINAQDNPPTWEELLVSWNKKYPNPEWKFGTSSGLRRAYMRAVEALAPAQWR